MTIIRFLNLCFVASQSRLLRTYSQEGHPTTALPIPMLKHNRGYFLELGSLVAKVGLEYALL